MIQGSLQLLSSSTSIDTLILPGMHLNRRLMRWWERIDMCGQDTGGFVHQVSDAMFTDRDS